MILIQEAPIWVWPLFLLLVWAGRRASRPRVVAPVTMYLMPALGGLAIRSTAGLPAATAAWIGLAVGAAAGIVMGYRTQARFITGRDGARVRLRGEWLTLSVMMTLFCANFAIGALSATAPDALTRPFTSGLIALLLGLASGTFAGRALRTAQYMRAGDAAAPRSSNPT